MRVQVSPSPHIRDDINISSVMFAVVLALVPACIGGVWFFGIRVLWVIVASSIAAVATEGICQKLTRRRVTISDGSALVTGILLAMNLPPAVPIWLACIGSVFAIAIAKIPFGGLGYNPLNPALAGRAFLLASWPTHMTTWSAPSRGSLSGISSVTTATPLATFKYAYSLLRSGSLQNVDSANTILRQLYSYPSLKNLFFGNVGGCIGETSVILLLVGAIYLLLRKIISWQTPLSYIGTVALMTWVFGGKGLLGGMPLFHVLSGGLILGAFFMATDMVTSPITSKGKLIFGFGCGILTSIIRLYGGYPEGVSYSILIMNITVPLIDKYTRPRKLGEVRK